MKDEQMLLSCELERRKTSLQKLLLSLQDVRRAVEVEGGYKTFARIRKLELVTKFRRDEVSEL
jgi:hypothetical protein